MRVDTVSLQDTALDDSRPARRQPTTADAMQIYLWTDITKSKFKAPRSNAQVIADHYDLASFLKYQSDKGVALTSSVYLGTRYEYLIQRHLQDHLGFSLTRIGGKGDGGVDLIGTWTLPNRSQGSASSSGVASGTTFRVLIQAKRLSAHRKPMPALMRELEGTLNSSTSARPISEAFQYHLLRKREMRLKFSPAVAKSARGSSSIADYSVELPTLAILVTTNPLTAGVQTFMASSQRNLMYICLEEILNADTSESKIPSTKINQITWNAAAAQAGLEGYNVGMRYAMPDSPLSTSAGNNLSTSEAILMYNGRPIDFHASESSRT
ncbi:hypothetical protein H2198_007332 [Neophaeococcomyces mojaviensis]|uniref:Uncharacterized protein n=1 Tax=Neophaeococcomyces mojaviensis TaxID=3383035 RepID=A0ACC3A0B8_9EURO|nr:hypothetical protein H2198_007332 [Knufia sp. JES_112]